MQSHGATGGNPLHVTRCTRLLLPPFAGDANRRRDMAAGGVKRLCRRSALGIGTGATHSAVASATPGSAPARTQPCNRRQARLRRGRPHDRIRHGRAAGAGLRLGDDRLAHRSSAAAMAAIAMAQEQGRH